VISDYIASKLSQLPQFRIEDIDHGPEKYGRGKQMIGRFSEPPNSEFDWMTELFLPDLRNICGTLYPAPEGDLLRLFQQHDHWPSDIADEELLSKPLAYLGRHTKFQIKLSLDPEIDWQEQPVPSESNLEKVRFTDADGRVQLLPLVCFEGATLPQGATVFQSDWSHRHCDFCIQRIESGEKGHLTVLPNGAETWICSWCFRNVVSARDLKPLLISVESRQYN
jgi:ribosomal protein L24E